MEIQNEKTEQEKQTVPVFAYELIRDIFMPEVLGKHTPDVLYWGGKTIARKFPLMSQEEIISFFHEAAWGDLSLIEQKRNEATFELSGELVSRRLEMKSDISFKLEAGFLAEQLQNQKKVLAEATDELHKRNKTIKILVRWDQKESIID
ncbi:YslB family protein [Rossellomorea sp. BNER]|uniref:YslB family protein n=1 Tax=Rossellomorea sp. BNER TaxID=2962031 RepID=UPI003AF30188|nr:YslB family protein [Rossellomorea sp. BNER]